MSRGPDAGTLVRRAIYRDAQDAGCGIQVTIDQSTRWASATFVGARHALSVDGQDDAVFAAWIARLPEADLPIRGHLVADLAIIAIRRAAGRAIATVEALTVET